MKISHLALIFVFLFGNLQVTFASESEMPAASVPTMNAEHACCEEKMSHHEMPHHDMAHHQMASSDHACCDHAHASNSGCPQCGDDCHCGNLTCHFLSYSVSLSDNAGLSFQPVMARLNHPDSVRFASIDLPREEQPPRFA